MNRAPWNLRDYNKRGHSQKERRKRVGLEKDSEIMTEHFPTWTGFIKLKIREAETLRQDKPKKPTTDTELNFRDLQTE